MELAVHLSLILLVALCLSVPCARQTTGNDPAMQAPPVHVPPGPEYADSKRMFQGIPGIERAANGRLWAVWYGGGPGEGPYNYCMLVTSGDDGKTWSDLKLVIDPPHDVRAFDPCLWHDPEGRLWLFWAQGHSLWDGKAGVWAIVTKESDRENPTWSRPRRLCDGIMMNKPTVLSSGEWLLPAAIWSHKPINLIKKQYAHELGSGSMAVCSKDKGRTWAVLGKSDVKGRSCDEHMIVERRDGTLWMLVRTTYGIGESVSKDRGKTWSVGRPSPYVTHIKSPARFHIRRLASGKLLLVKHDPASRKGRSHLTAFVSSDDGKTWQGGLLLDERTGVSYPDGVQAPDGTIYIIYDYSRTGAKQILMATFTEKDVLAKRCVSDRARLRVLINQATGKRPPEVRKSDLRPNDDGQPLLNGPAAVFEPLEGETATLARKAKLFTNRRYVVHDCPASLAGKTFIRSSIDRVRAVCRKKGVVYVVTPLPDRNRDSVTKDLLRLGFQKARVPEFLLFGAIKGNICSVYQRQAEAGEKVELGKWGVLIF